MVISPNGLLQNRFYHQGGLCQNKDVFVVFHAGVEVNGDLTFAFCHKLRAKNAFMTPWVCSVRFMEGFLLERCVGVYVNTCQHPAILVGCFLPKSI